MLARVLSPVRFATVTAAAFVLAAAPFGALEARILIVEIHYHPPGPAAAAESLEFVELYNDEPLPFDLAGYTLEGGVDFRFPPGTVEVPARGVAVVARDPGALAAAYGIEPPYGPFAGRLDNAEDPIFLKDTGGSTVCHVAYDDRGRWPAAADGAGPSLVLRSPLLDPTEGESWGWSAVAGGTPGTVSFETVEPEVVLNEVYRDEEGSWIELFNPGSVELDLAGYELRADPSGAASFVLPAGATIPPRGFLLIGAAETGLALAPLGQRLFLVAPRGERVMDAHHLEESPAAGSDGRAPDGGPRWYVLESPTPGAPNIPPPASPLLISEIHYHPYSQDPQEDAAELEFIELLNTAAEPVSLEGFAFTAGVDFAFPPGAVAAAGAYVVVARNPAALAAAYGLTGVYGPWTGVLADRGEVVRLRDPRGDPADEVHYRDDGTWPRWPDGDGPSLELVDSRQDNAAGTAWQESDQEADSEWRFHEYTASQVNASESEFHLYLLGAGEVLVDSLEVVPQGGGPNHLRNGTFDAAGEPVAGWRLLGTHVESRLEPGAGPDGSNALRVVASKRGDTRVNHIEQDTSPPLGAGRQYTVRFWARWLRGTDLLMTRSWGHGIAHATRLEVPPLGGTPGRTNSRARENTGPVLAAVEQSPALPAPGEPVTVRARVRDPDGVAVVTLHWRLDGQPEFAETPMATVGPSGGAAGETLYAGRIETAAAPRAVAEFFITAEDLPGATRSYPPQAPEQTLLYQYADGIDSGGLPAYRIVMRAADYEELLSRSMHSNHRLPASLVYGSEQVIPLAGVRYKGSPVVRPHPGIGVRRAFRVRLGDESPLRGRVRLALDESGPDPSYQADRLINHFMHRSGCVPYGERNHIHLIVRGASFGIYEDALAVNPAYLQRRWGGGGDDGTLYKVDNHYEVGDGGGYVYMKGPWRFSKNPEDLRFTFKKRTREKEDDFSDLIELLRLLDPARTRNSDFDARAGDVLDLENWLRALAVYRVAGDWDAPGGTTGKNVYLYHHPDGPWHMIPWDHDVSLGAWPENPSASQGPSAPLYLSDFPPIQRLLLRPPFDRRFLAEVKRLLEEEFVPEKTDRILLRSHELLARSPAAASPCPEVNPLRPCYQSPARLQNFIRARRSYLLRVVTGPEQLTIETNGGEPFTTPEGSVLLEGEAPYAIETLVDRSGPLAVTWWTRARWEAEVALEPGANEFDLVGLDRFGNVVDTAGITVTRAVAGFVRGDCNGDGRVQGQVTDAVFLLRYGFAGGTAPGCLAACDADGDGELRWVTDAVRILRHNFSGAPPPAAPFPDCGPPRGAADEALGCEAPPCLGPVE